MKTIAFTLSLVLLSSAVNAVINQEAQRREAPIAPQNEYGAPIQRPVQPPQQQYGPPVNQRRLQAMQRLIAAMRQQQAGGYASQGRVVNRPRPIPLQKPQNNYGPPPQNNYGPPQQNIQSPPPQNSYGPPAPQVSAGGHSSGSGSLHAFAHNHNPGFSCEGWIPIPGPSIGTGNSASGAASIASSVDTSYGPPAQTSSQGVQSTLIVVPEDNYGPPPPPPQNSYGPPQISSSAHGHSSSSGSIDTSYGPPPSPPQNSYGPPQISSSAHGHSSSSGSIDTSYGPPPSPPQNSYGPPQISSSAHGHSSSLGSIDTSYGIPPPPVNPQNSYGPPQVSGSGHSSSSSIAAIDNSYGAPQPSPPVQIHNEYGVPHHQGGPDIPPQPIDVIVGSGHASNAAAIEHTYGPPQQPIAPPQIEYGPPQQEISPPQIEYGPPPQIITHESAHGSAGGSFSIEQTYGPPVQPIAQPVPEYGPPQIASGHSSSSAGIESNFGGHQQIGHQTYGVPTNPADFGPPESSYGPPPSGAVHLEDVRHGHAVDVHSIQSIGSDLQLPEVDSNIRFNNDIGIGTSALGVSAGNSEVIKAQTIHESHTSEVTHNSGGSDTYSAPPLDSYAPGKYAPSFLTRKPPVPTPPARRPVAIQRPQYIPPVPQKLHRPQAPPPSFRPIPQNGHAHSVAQSYASHSQSVHQQQPIRAQQPRQPLVYRQPVPQGLLQSIGQHVQAQDQGHRGQIGANTYLPPPASELPIPPMKLIVPNPGPVQPFHGHSYQSQQSHHSGSGVATSSSSFQLQNQNLGNVQIIHDCGKGPQINYPQQIPHQTYGVPQNFGDSHSAVLSAGYTVPAQNLEIPQHNSANFQQPSNNYGPPSDSYGPPASGPASLDVLGLDPRSNHHSELQTAESQNVASASLPGLSGGLGGLDFISAHKSHTLVLPKNQGGSQEFKFHIQGSHAGVDENRLDGTNHQEILAEGLLQSILSAIEQKPSPDTVPQVSEGVETEHKDAQIFLKSKEGQEVLADKSEASSAH